MVCANKMHMVKHYLHEIAYVIAGDVVVRNIAASVEVCVL